MKMVRINLAVISLAFVAALSAPIASAQSVSGSLTDPGNRVALTGAIV
jgi:hypothetical protein